MLVASTGPLKAVTSEGDLERETTDQAMAGDDEEDDDDDEIEDEEMEDDEEPTEVRKRILIFFLP